MTDDPSKKENEANSASDVVLDLVKRQNEAMREVLGPLMPDDGQLLPKPGDAVQWADATRRMQEMLVKFQMDEAKKVLSSAIPAAADPQSPDVNEKSTSTGMGLNLFGNPAQTAAMMQEWVQQMPLANAAQQEKLWSDSLALFETVMGQYGVGPRAHDHEGGADDKNDKDGTATGPDEAELPRSDARFSDPLWRSSPYFVLLHQGYLLIAEQLLAMAKNVPNLEPHRQEQLVFATQAVIDAMSPSNYPMTNPVALARARETHGESLVHGMQNLLDDLEQGQLSHTARGAFELGRNIAVTPGKVVYETPLFQLIQYSPVTDKVLETPIVIFPPWINRFYILDLNEKKSFVRWAVAQGLTVFIVSWKSADSSMRDVVWDDYVKAQITAIDVVRERLRVPSVHTVGYCVAGTTLAATLAVLARRGDAEKVASATFFTAQVDFEDAGPLRAFIDNQIIEGLKYLGAEGYVDGRYMAATFNMLRGNDLIWSYVTRNYLLGEENPPFDLLYWNGDVTNLPARWHCDYLRDLYRDNRMVVPDSLSVLDTPIDLRLIKTPCYIQAGREDHIAPPQSVWKLTRHLSGPWTFVLAGSGHIAGVVNPPSAGKYQYWLNNGPADTLEAFIAGAAEHPGSWWTHWEQWIKGLGGKEIRATGKRKPGGRGDKVIEDAPGRYVAMR